MSLTRHMVQSMRKAYQFAFVVGIGILAGCATDRVGEQPSEVCQPAGVSADSHYEKIRPPVPPSGIMREGDAVVVTIYIDAVAERLKGSRLEGTGMLRTSWHLRKAFPKLPKKYSIPSRLLKRQLDRVTGIYTYSTRYLVADIEKAEIQTDI